MKAVVSALVLVLTLSASAESEAPPVESVIVTAPAQRPEDALNQFIISHAAPTPALGKIARWKRGICPITIGLPGKFDAFITQRLIRVAMMAKVPLDQAEPCRPNVLVLATDKPLDLLDFVRAKRPALLGFHYRGHAQKLATMTLPIQAWYSTATEDFYGFLSADLPSFDLGYGVMSSNSEIPGMHVSGSRNGDGLKSEFATAIIVVDTRKIAGQQIGALADYIAMLALSQANTYAVCQPVPTITNLMSDKCDAALKPQAITDIDATYLRGLYGMDAGRSLQGERSSIAYEMKKDLGGY